MYPFEYQRPQSLEEAFRFLSRDGSELLAGGTDLLTLMKQEIAAPKYVVDIKRLEALPREIQTVRDGGVRVGALATLSDVQNSATLAGPYAALAEAAEVAATPQLRNMATVGGNLLQRPRCWYFRNPHLHCWLKGGDDCFARDGRNEYHAIFDISPCVAAHPSDLAPALLVLDAEVHLQWTDGERRVALENFFAAPAEERRRETRIGRDELLLSVRIPGLPAAMRSTYVKAMARKVWAFALVSVAAAVHVQSGQIEDVRIALGGVAPVPLRARAVESALVGQPATIKQFEEAAALAVADAQPLEYNQYKIALARRLIVRALQRVTDGREAT